MFEQKDYGKIKKVKEKSRGLTYYQDYKNKNKMVGYEHTDTFIQHLRKCKWYIMEQKSEDY